MNVGKLDFFDVDRDSVTGRKKTKAFSWPVECFLCERSPEERGTIEFHSVDCTSGFSLVMDKS